MPNHLHREGGLYVIEVALPFRDIPKVHEIRFVLDTGAAITIVDTDLIDQLGYSARADGVSRSALEGAAGKSIGYVIRVPYFRCLGCEIRDFEIACHDMDTRLGVAGLLGMNFLSHLRLDVNFYTGEVLRVEKVKP